MLPVDLGVLAVSHTENALRGVFLVAHLVGLAFWFLVVLVVPVREHLALRSEDLERARSALRTNHRLETWVMVPALLLVTLSGGLLLIDVHSDISEFFIVELLVTVGVIAIVTMVVIPATKAMWQAAEKAEDYEDARETLVKFRLKELAFGFIPVVGTLYLAIARAVGVGG